MAARHGISNLSHPHGIRTPATARFPLLPQCFPDTSRKAGEAKSGPEGPL